MGNLCSEPNGESYFEDIVDGRMALLGGISNLPQYIKVRRFRQQIISFVVGRDPFTWHGLILIPSWISNYIHYQVVGWHYLSIPKLQQCNRRVWEWIIRFHYTLVWLIDICDEWGIKWFQRRLHRVWNRFIPHESQVLISHDQGVVDSLSRSPIKSVFQPTNNAIPACRRLSHHPHSNKKVVLSCTWRKGRLCVVQSHQGGT